MASEANLCHSDAMERRNARGGGFFLIAAIFAGVFAGVALGSPILGALAGTLVGIGLAVATWIVDRRNAG